MRLAGVPLRLATAGSFREIAAAQSLSRRRFLRDAVGTAAAGRVFAAGPVGAQALRVPRAPKAVVVTFGGGARDAETFAPEGQENIPHMLAELIPQATFYTQVVNHGILGHYVATASLATGVYESFNNFADVAPHSPTVFEYMRRDLGRPANDAWVVAPSNGFGRIGESDARGYGAGLGARVILPKHLLAAAMAGKPGAAYEHLLRDNYETPLFDPSPTGVADAAELHRTAELLRLSVDDFRAHAESLTSPDELSVYIARQLMRQVAPSLLWITLHDIDIAHSGAFSLYVDGIRRSDRLVAEVWRAINAEPEYRGRTTMFVLPDFGRGLGRGRRRQRLSAPPDGGCTFAHDVDAGDGAGGAGGRGDRPAG